MSECNFTTCEYMVKGKKLETKVKELQAKIEELTKPIEDAEVRDWIDYKYAKANSYKSLGDALDIIERLARKNAELQAKVAKLEAEQNKKLIKELDWVHDELLDYCDTAAECRDQLVSYTQKLITQGEVNDD